MADGASRAPNWMGRAFAVLALLALLAPFAISVWMSFAPGELLEPPTDRWSLRWYEEFLGSTRWMRALATSVQVAGMTAIVSVAGGLGLSIAVSRYHFRGRRLLSAAVLLPLFTPAVVLAMGLLPITMAVGLRGTVIAIVAAHSLVGLPVVFLIVRASLSQVDPDLERAARGLGAGPWRTFRRVTAPLIFPGVIAGGLAAFILSINEFVLALFLSTPRVRTLPAALWPAARDKETPLLAAASCLIALTSVVGMAAAMRLWQNFTARRGL